MVYKKLDEVKFADIFFFYLYDADNMMRRAIDLLFFQRIPNETEFCLQAP